MFLLLAALPVTGAAMAPADDAPFWTESPDAAEFSALQERRIAEAESALARLVADPGPRTIARTLRAYDDLLRRIEQVASPSSLIENVHPDAALRAAAEAASRRAAAFASALALNRDVYDAIAAIDVSAADPATRHYVETILRDFRLAGVDRDDATRERVRQLREELVAIGQEFARHIRDDVRSVAADGAGALAGLPADFIAAHPPDADGRITITTQYPDYVPVMTYAESDDLRRRLYLEFSNRAFPANTGTLHRLLERRHELATLLGHASWAAYITADKMAASDRVVRGFIDRVVAASGERAARDHDVLLARKRERDASTGAIHPWESAYWSEQVRRAAYDFDAQSVRPYFPYRRVKQGILDLTSRLFGVEFRPAGAPTWHEAVESWEVFEDGALIGRFYLDMHPRPGKYNHAAQFDIRTGVRGRQIPEAVLVCNFPGGRDGDPGLLEHGDVETFLHEFGHLLHHLFARQEWLGISGIRAEHDFIEVPSQLLEEWAWDAASLATFARHHQTDEPIPATLVEQMRRARDFGKGLQVRRQMVFADMSLSCYDRAPEAVNADSLMAALAARYLPYPQVPDIHPSCSFGHLDGYSAVYYAYMWSLVIAKDMFGRFDRDDLLTPGVARRLRAAVLEPGAAKPATEIVHDFLGRPFAFDVWEEWLAEGE